MSKSVVDATEELLNKLNNKNCEYYFANDIYYAQDIYTAMNKKAFDRSSIKKGIILMINPYGVTNEVHDYYYCFINKKEFFYSKKKGPWANVKNTKITDINTFIHVLQGIRDE